MKEALQRRSKLVEMIPPGAYIQHRKERWRICARIRLLWR